MGVVNNFSLEAGKMKSIGYSYGRWVALRANVILAFDLQFNSGCRTIAASKP
jgi:hypothetical protein